MDSGGSERSKDRQGEHVQVDAEESFRTGCGKLYVVGLGPGDRNHMSQRALSVLKKVETVVGYTTYIRLIEDMLDSDQTVLSTGMRKERERAEMALDLACRGQSVAVVSSGDPGVYGMAGLVLELMLRENYRLPVEIIPGITAGQAASSLLGAPLMHDHAVISLSDILTPWPVIARRLESAAAADFIIVLYNPKSKRRREHIRKAADILLKHRSPEVPVGVVRNALRGSQQQVTITSLGQLAGQQIDMLTTVIVGNSKTYADGQYMVTPRGYDLHSEGNEI